MKTVSHMFMPGDTIIAALKKYNCYTSDEEVISKLHEQFTLLNGDGVFRPGSRVDIPILVEPEQIPTHSDIQKEHQ